MRLYTIQDIKFYEILKKQGYITANYKKVYEGFSFEVKDKDVTLIDKNWKYAYDWMSSKMIQKLDTPTRMVNYPLWAYYQWRGPKKVRPDLRSYVNKNNKVKNKVMIEFEIDDSLVILSDINKWDLVLFGNIVGDEYEQNEFEEKCKKITGKQYLNVLDEKITEELKNEIINSWERIFDLNRTEKEQEWLGPINEQTIQATFWELKVEYIKKVDFFSGI